MTAPLLRSCFIAICLAVFSPASLLADGSTVSVENPWSRASIGTSRPGAAYMTLTNSGSDSIEFKGLKTDLAKMVELHQSETDTDGVTTMRPAGQVIIEPGESVVLEPGGLHVMLMKLQRPLVEGETYPATLMFSDGTELNVEIPILAVGATGMEHSH